MFLQTLGVSDLAGLGALTTFFAAYFVFALILSLALYVYMALALMTIAKRTSTENGWLAWIPIANFYLLTQIAGKSGHWTWLYLAAAIPFVGWVLAGVGIWFFWITAEKVGMPGWTSLLLLLPLVNLIVLGMYAWKK